MFRTLLLPVALLATSIAAQTYSSCNPLNSTCPADPALGTTYATSFNSSQTEFDPNFWNITAGLDLITFGEDGAELAIVNEGDSVTVQSKFYIFWGQVEIIMKAAAGQGIISTMNLLSDDLDEIDWEIMGGNESYVENNWYGWGNQSQHNAQYPALSGSAEGFHNYTVIWNQEQTQWLIDGNVIRTVPYAQPGEYPQTPMFVKFGLWAGGAPSEPKGTIAWAGGKTDFSKRYVRSWRAVQPTFILTLVAARSQCVSKASKSPTARQTPARTATRTPAVPTRASHLSRKQAHLEKPLVFSPANTSDSGESEAYHQLHHKTTIQKAEQTWSGLSSGAKIGIAVGVIGGVVIALIIFIFYILSQRRKGRAERVIADKEWEAQKNELLEYRRQMAKGGFAVTHIGHGEKF